MITDKKATKCRITLQLGSLLELTLFVDYVHSTGNVDPLARISHSTPLRLYPSRLICWLAARNDMHKISDETLTQGPSSLHLTCCNKMVFVATRFVYFF